MSNALKQNLSRLYPQSGRHNVHRRMAPARYPVHFRALEEARDAVTVLRTLKPLLTEQDAETLAILMDKELVSLLDKSLVESKKAQFEPLQSILA
jgi:hypothetical protein